MTKNLKKCKARVIAGIILVSFFVLFTCSSCENVSAGSDIFKTSIEMRYEGAGSVNPEAAAIFNITLDYKLMGPFSTGEIELLYFPPTVVKLEIIEGDEDWITPSLAQSTITITPDEDREVMLTVAITPEAPYLKSHNIIIRATAEKNSIWTASENELTVTIYPEFLYFVSATTELNYAEVGPPGTHKFPVTVVNDASYVVKYYFEAKNIPKNWVVSAPNSLTVNAKSREKAMISVTPPYDFGYHDEIAAFTVDVYAEPFPTTQGYEREQVDSLNFQIKNRGFSTAFSGAGIFVFIFGIIAILVLIMIFFFYFQRRKKKSE